MLEGARVKAERERMEIHNALPPAALMGLAARELAGKLQSIEHLSVTPDCSARCSSACWARGAKLEAE